MTGAEAGHWGADQVGAWLARCDLGVVGGSRMRSFRLGREGSVDSMRAEAALAVDFSGVPSSPVGDRRFVLPLSTFTTLVVAAATASWWHQCTHRNRGPGPTRKMANSLGIPRYFANVLPEEKVELVSNLQSEGRSVCFVGDGINDSISLKKANVSVSLRGASTVAIDSAQIILTGQGLQQ
ncbi:MAG: hypothetical protein ACRD0K_30305, partial [Egibacteraceae bacterium]